MSITEKRSTGLKLSQVSRPITVKEQVYLTLREQLMHGQPGPNGRVSEKELTDALGVSRTPVREALTRLASEGLLIVTRHGFRVPEFTVDDVAHLFEVRLLLEPIAAQQAAENRSDAGIAEMRRAIAEEKDAHPKGSVTRFLRAHSTFREAWLRRARNPLLLETLGRTLHSLQVIRRRVMSDEMMRKFMIGSHEALLAAIESGNGVEAKRVQTQTIREFQKLVMTRVFSKLGH